MFTLRVLSLGMLVSVGLVCKGCVTITDPTEPTPTPAPNTTTTTLPPATPAPTPAQTIRPTKQQTGLPDVQTVVKHVLPVLEKLFASKFPNGATKTELQESVCEMVRNPEGFASDVADVASQQDWSAVQRYLETLAQDALPEPLKKVVTEAATVAANGGIPAVLNYLKSLAQPLLEEAKSLLADSPQDALPEELKTVAKEIAAAASKEDWKEAVSQKDWSAVLKDLESKAKPQIEKAESLLKDKSMLDGLPKEVQDMATNLATAISEQDWEEVSQQDWSAVRSYVESLLAETPIEEAKAALAGLPQPLQEMATKFATAVSEQDWERASQQDWSAVLTYVESLVKPKIEKATASLNSLPQPLKEVATNLATAVSKQDWEAVSKQDWSVVLSYLESSSKSAIQGLPEPIQELAEAASKQDWTAVSTSLEKECEAKVGEAFDNVEQNGKVTFHDIQRAIGLE